MRVTRMMDDKSYFEDWNIGDVEVRLVKISLLIGLFVTVILLLLGKFLLAISFILGSLISFLNFLWLKQGIDTLITTTKVGSKGIKRSIRSVILKYFIRYIFIGLVLYGIVYFESFEAVGAFSGLFLFVAAVLIECCYHLIKGIIEDFIYGAS